MENIVFKTSSRSTRNLISHSSSDQNSIIQAVHKERSRAVRLYQPELRINAFISGTAKPTKAGQCMRGGRAEARDGGSGRGHESQSRRAPPLMPMRCMACARGRASRGGRIEP